MTDFSKWLCRCSSIYRLMTPPKSKEAKASGELGETAKTFLREAYRETRYQRRREYGSKYTEKGITQEENGITALSRFKKHFYKKNTIRLYNEFLTGEPDLFKGSQIIGCEEGSDVKCSWDIFTFPYPDDVLDSQYYYQDLGYMALTGAKKWTTSYCLVNATGDQVLNEKKSLWYKMGCPSEFNYAYVEKCVEIEKNLIFNMEEFLKENPRFDFHCTDWKYDIPLKERVIEFEVLRDDDVIESIYRKVEKARKYLMHLDYQLTGDPSVFTAEYHPNDKVTLIQ